MSGSRQLRRIGGNQGWHAALSGRMEFAMGRYLLLWLVGVPIPLLVLIWTFGGSN